MRFYPSKTMNKLNGRPWEPEKFTPYICLSPHYHASPNKGALPMLDSGAFQDVITENRLSFKGALERQLRLEEKKGFVSDKIVSYDRLVDEQVSNEKKLIKKRVTPEIGLKFVEESIDAGKYLADNRKELEPRTLVLSNQGVNQDQYLYCIQEILKFSEPQDTIGLGAFCIVGKKPYLQKEYFKILNKAIPLIRKKGIRDVHVFGVGVLKVLIKTDIIAKMHGINMSYDTSSYELNGINGITLINGFEGFKRKYTQEQKFIDYHPNELAHKNIEAVCKFWDTINQTTLWYFDENKN